MSEKMQKRELHGAIAGIALLALAMAWRWLFPWIERIDWSRPPPAPPELVVPARVQELAAQPAPETEIEEEPVPEPGDLDDAQRKQVDEWLAAANAAVVERRWISPEDDNALKWYGEVLGVDPGDSKARIGRAAVLDSLFAQADNLLDDSDAKHAEDLVAALDAQGIADRRARGIALRITRLSEVRAQLAEAAQRIASGSLFEPSDASAVAAFRDVLVLDARNRAAQKACRHREPGAGRGLACRFGATLCRCRRDCCQGGCESAPESSNRVDVETQIADLKQRAGDDLVLRAEAALARATSPAPRSCWSRRAHSGLPKRASPKSNNGASTPRSYANYQPGDRFSDAFADRSGQGPELVVVPVGEFAMGSPDSETGRSANEGPLHRCASRGRSR